MQRERLKLQNELIKSKFIQLLQSC